MLLLLCYVHKLVSYMIVAEGVKFNYNLDFTKVQTRINTLRQESTSQLKEFKFNIFEDS